MSPDIRAALFERVFGSLAALNPDQVSKVQSAPASQRHYVDDDQDGQPDEVWFIDTDSRHPEEFRPLLVKSVDEDGDLEMGGEPDFDSDLYFADWKADGVVDVVLDYTDSDGDGDVDEMGMYFFDSGGQRFGEPVLRCWWGRDDGDDNLLWYDVGYTYRQNLCQYRTHFGGDESFVYFAITQTGPEWVPNFENPFLFYDLDFDGITEEVLRIDGDGPVIHNLRHSFDADNDATAENPRDYDVSITAYAPDDLRLAENLSEQILLRGIPTGRFLLFRGAPAFTAPIAWEKVLFTWDEDDRNIDRQNFADSEERWEGVIAAGNSDFRQVGGPTCGPWNKRYELDLAPDGANRFYYHPADHRIHLRGADKAWMEADLDNDRKTDLRYEMSDTDSDGFLDTWRLDVEADGTFDEEWQVNPSEVRPVQWNWADVNAAIQPVLAEVPEDLFLLNEELGKAIYSWSGDPPQDRVGFLFRNSFNIPEINTDLQRKILSSPETLRFYLDIHKDLLIRSLRFIFPDPAFWEEFSAARAEGQYLRMAALIDERFHLSPSGRTLENWRKQRLEKIQPQQAAWAEDWVPPNIGWESDLAAYRCYWGQFDFFGKKSPGLILPAIGSQSYHQETNWGIDALEVGKSCGLGGVTLYINGQAFAVRNPAGQGSLQFSKRMVTAERDRVVIEITADGVGPEPVPYSLRLVCSIEGGHRDTRIEAVLEGGRAEDQVELGIGLQDLPHQENYLDTNAGVFATRGLQSIDIGWIGLGVVFPPGRFLRFADLPEENQVVLGISRSVPLVYHLEGDWLRGRRFNSCPTGSDWLDELRQLAAALHLQ